MPLSSQLRFNSCSSRTCDTRRYFVMASTGSRWMSTFCQYEFSRKKIHRSPRHSQVSFYDINTKHSLSLTSFIALLNFQLTRSAADPQLTIHTWNGHKGVQYISVQDHFLLINILKQQLWLPRVLQQAPVAHICSFSRCPTLRVLLGWAMASDVVLRASVRGENCSRRISEP